MQAIRKHLSVTVYPVCRGWSGQMSGRWDLMDRQTGTWMIRLITTGKKQLMYKTADRSPES